MIFLNLKVLKISSIFWYINNNQRIRIMKFLNLMISFSQNSENKLNAITNECNKNAKLWSIQRLKLAAKIICFIMITHYLH